MPYLTKLALALSGPAKALIHCQASALSGAESGMNSCHWLSDGQPGPGNGIWCQWPLIGLPSASRKALAKEGQVTSIAVLPSRNAALLSSNDIAPPCLGRC